MHLLPNASALTTYPRLQAIRVGWAGAIFFIYFLEDKQRHSANPSGAH
jgi:hypothetical protein